MEKLIDVYGELVKEAEVKVAEEKVAELAKYAEAADTLLAAEYGDDYNAEDVEKLASMMYEHDMGIVPQETEKVAELQEAGRIMARAFIEELQAAQ
ncbi:MAG TPA: hypothetical protein PKN48_00720 [Bacteroidales bacterium]|nr:hypothetical protein [Bacteroidales bacterium]